MLNWEQMKYARISSANEKAFDGRANDIKEEKTWNEHRNVLLDKKSYNINKKSLKNKTKKYDFIKIF